MSAFFVSSAEPDMSDLVSPKLVPNGVGTCTRGDPDVSLEACKEIADGTENKFKDSSYFILNSESFTSVNSDGFTVVSWSFTCENCGFGGSFRQFPSYAQYIYNRTSETCPPDDYPEHTISVSVDDDTIKCAKPYVPEDCPAGYHSKAVSKALGSTECIPKECPPAGSGQALYTSPNLGSSFSGGGMYCNDGCAYSVSGANITSDKHATGTSQGAACGDKPYDNKKLADEADSDKCSTASNGDVTILSCEAATPTNDPKDPLDNDDSKTGDEPTPDKPKENCADGDTICNLKNLEIQMQNSSQQTIDNQNELHNKQVDVQTKNTQAIVDSIDGLDTSIYLQTKQDERLHTVTVSKFNELIGAVNGIETGGGGGSGNGNTSGLNDGTCVGEGCSDESLYNGECEGELCDLDIVAELQESDNSLIEWFQEAVTIPNEFSSSFTNMTNFVSANFASFNGTCIPFTLEVSIQGRPKQITVSEHCEPYETYFKPLVEWLLYTLTAFTVFNMLAQVFRSFSRI